MRIGLVAFKACPWILASSSFKKKSQPELTGISAQTVVRFKKSCDSWCIIFFTQSLRYDHRDMASVWPRPPQDMKTIFAWVRFAWPSIAIPGFHWPCNKDHWFWVIIHSLLCYVSICIFYSHTDIRKKRYLHNICLAAYFQMVSESGHYLEAAGYY
jgi:hypothetical protein